MMQLNDMTIGRIIEAEQFRGAEIKVMIGRSVEEAIAGGKIVLNVDRHTVVSDRQLRSGTLIIAVDDSTAEDDLNIKRYKAMGMTYAQAKVVHLRNLGYEQSEIAAVEKTTRAAIQSRERFANKKMCGTVLYERR